MTEDSGFEASVELGAAMAVSDLDRALDFYGEVLGFAVVFEEEDPGTGGRMATIRYGNALLELSTRPSAERKRGDIQIYWRVDDLEKAIEHLVAGGGSIVRRMEYGVYCADPDGNTILVKAKDLDPEQAQELFF